MGRMLDKSIFRRYELTFSKNLMDLTEKTDCKQSILVFAS